MKSLTLELNGSKVTYEVEPRETLADFLRERCRLTATHLGCEHLPARSLWADKSRVPAFDLRSCVTVIPCRRSKAWTMIPQWTYYADIFINVMAFSADFARPVC